MTPASPASPSDPGRAFGGTPGEEQARAFDVYGYTLLAFKEG
jgi:hypothetical protein